MFLWYFTSRMEVCLENWKRPPCLCAIVLSTTKSGNLGSRSGLHTSIALFFYNLSLGSGIYCYLLFHLQNGDVFGKLKEATMPVCQCPTTSASANLRKKVVSLIRILNKSKTFSQWSSLWIHISCFRPWYILWNQLGAHLVNRKQWGLRGWKYQHRLKGHCQKTNTKFYRDTSKLQTQ